MKNKIVNVIALLFIILNITSSTILASSGGASSSKDFWGNANSWFSSASHNNSSNQSKTNDTVKEIIDTMEDMVLVVGTTVISIATIFLGIKYMFGSADSKADSKESLMNLLVACVFFFGWNSIKNVLMPGNRFVFFSVSDTTYKDPVARFYDIFVYIAQFAAIIAIIYVGVKYIFAGVQGKADLKEKSGTFLIGIILAFCSTGFLTYISKVINEAII